MLRSMTTEVNREHVACHFLRTHRGWNRRPHSSLYAERAGSPLAGRVLLPLLPDHRPSFLVALYVLDGGARGRRSGGPLLASLVRPGLHAVHVLDVQDVAPRHAYDRRRPALVEGDEILHRERR